MTDLMYIDRLCFDDAQLLLLQDNLTKEQVDEFEKEVLKRASEELRVSLEGVVKVLRKKLEEQNEKDAR